MYKVIVEVTVSVNVSVSNISIGINCNPTCKTVKQIHLSSSLIHTRTTPDTTPGIEVLLSWRRNMDRYICEILSTCSCVIIIIVILC